MRAILSYCIATVVLLLASTASYGHGPSRQKVTETITIDAPPAEVWAAVKDFDQAHTWLPMVTSSRAEGGNEKGVTRVLTLNGGGEIHEVLKKYRPEKMSFSYRIPTEGHDVTLLPVSNYTSTLTVSSAPGGGALVTWKSGFYRGYPNNDPPPELNDDAAVNAVTGLYQASLENLKKLLEAD